MFPRSISICLHNGHEVMSNTLAGDLHVVSGSDSRSRSLLSIDLRADLLEGLSEFTLEFKSRDGSGYNETVSSPTKEY